MSGRCGAGAAPGDEVVDAGAYAGVDLTQHPDEGVQISEIEGLDEVEHVGLREASGDQDAAEQSSRSGSTSRSHPEAEPQVWEQKVPGSDLALTRLHLQVDDEGRVRLHEAVVAQLLHDAGWERAS